MKTVLTFTVRRDRSPEAAPVRDQWSGPDRPFGAEAPATFSITRSNQGAPRGNIDRGVCAS